MSSVPFEPSSSIEVRGELIKAEAEDLLPGDDDLVFVGDDSEVLVGHQVVHCAASSPFPLPPLQPGESAPSGEKMECSLPELTLGPTPLPLRSPRLPVPQLTPKATDDTLWAVEGDELPLLLVKLRASSSLISSLPPNRFPSRLLATSCRQNTDPDESLRTGLSVGKKPSSLDCDEGSPFEDDLFLGVTRGVHPARFSRPPSSVWRGG